MKIFRKFQIMVTIFLIIGLYAGIASETGVWARSTFSTGARLEEHFAAPSAEWGNITKVEYVQKARDLLNSNVGGDIKGFTNGLGYTFRYNSVTNEFAIGHPNGTVSTLFHPSEGMQYWLEQVAKYGDL